jgi:hypothetical protein
MEAFEFELAIDDLVLAYKAAMATARRFQEDVAIMPDLAVIRLSEADEPPLEVICYVDGSIAPAVSSSQIH